MADFVGQNFKTIISFTLRCLWRNVIKENGNESAVVSQQIFD